MKGTPNKKTKKLATAKLGPALFRDYPRTKEGGGLDGVVENEFKVRSAAHRFMKSSDF